MKVRHAIILIAAAALSTGAEAQYARSKHVLREFVSQQACPLVEMSLLPYIRVVPSLLGFESPLGELTSIRQ